VGTDSRRLLFNLSVMDYLWERGFHRMSRLIKNTDGRMYVECTDGLAFLTEWIEGRHVNFLNRFELKKSVHLLAEMHLLGEGFDPPKNCHPRNDIGQWEEKWRRRIEDLEKMAVLSLDGRTSFDVEFQKIYPFSIKDAWEALDALSLIGYGSYCLKLQNKRPICHRDFVYHNIIYQEPNVYLIDFDYCVQDSRVTDLARFVRTCGKRYNWKEGLAEEIVYWYHRYYPLSLREQELLLAVLKFPHEIWRAGHRWYFSSRRPRELVELIKQELSCRGEKIQVLRRIREGFTP
jgi:CotS family spore coat protein